MLRCFIVCSLAEWNCKLAIQYILTILHSEFNCTCSLSALIHTIVQARSQDLEKGGGYFERVRSVETTLTRIFIDLKSVSHGLSKFETKYLEKIEN